MSRPTIVVYGANSYTGHNHLLPYLATHRDADKFDVILAGRSWNKLTATNTLLSGKRREVVVCDLDDKEALDKLVQRADVVINLAGPYATHNAVKLIRACVNSGKHYLDLSGEVNWLRKQVIYPFDFQAGKTGSVVISMAGFEALPGDITIYYALRELQLRSGRSVGIRETNNYYEMSGGVSGGTVASVTTVAERGDAATNENSLLETSWNGVAKPFKPKFVYTTPAVPGAPSLGAYFAFSATNIPAYRRSWYLSRLNPATLAGNSANTNEKLTAAFENEPRHGDSISFQEALTKMGKLDLTTTFMATLYSFLTIVVGGLYMASGLFRKLAKPYLPQPGDGPDVALCRKGYANLTNVSFADNGLTVVTKYQGKGDPGYVHTSALISEAALSLVLPAPKGTTLPPLGRIGGVLTPSTALGMVLIERLRQSGMVTIESEIIDPDEETIHEDKKKI